MPTLVSKPARSATRFDFAGAPLFRKTASLDKAAIEWASRVEEVVTVISGMRETKKVAEPGDAIITGPKGERYVIDGKKFADLYYEDPRDANRYISKNVVRAIRLDDETEIVAPWGEKQRTGAGGWVVQSVARPTDIYLIDGAVFASTYSPV